MNNFLDRVSGRPDFRVDADIADELHSADPDSNAYSREQWKHLHVFFKLINLLRSIRTQK